MLSLLLSRNGIVFVALVAFVAWGNLALKSHDRKVEKRAVAAITEATDHAVSIGQSAARKSREAGAKAASRTSGAVSRRVREGTIDPTTRND